MSEHFKGRLLSNRVIIQQNLADAEIDGFLLSAESQEKKSSGVVIKLGPDVKDIVLGHTVVYDKGEGTEIIKGGVKFIIVRDTSIILDVTASVLYGNRLMIQQHDPNTEIGGISIALESQLKKPSGEIVNVGKDVKEIELGMDVIYDKYEGVEFVKDDQKFIVLREPNIIFINEK